MLTLGFSVDLTTYPPIHIFYLPLPEIPCRICCVPSYIDYREQESMVNHVEYTCL